MRFATWNINSVRARSERVVSWLQRAEVDLLAVQETKCAEEQFPRSVFEEIGYEVAHHDTSQWNGVGVISRVGIDDVEIGFDGQPGWGDPAEAEARAIAVRAGGIQMWSLYIPNGRTLDSPHYTYKLDWVSSLATTAGTWLTKDAQAQIVLAGDWNIAPQDDDVWDMAEFAESTHVSQPERDVFDAVVQAGYTDVVRRYAPGPGVYTYWDYKQLSFPKRKGMRIDFTLCSSALAARVSDAYIDREERKGKGASDHAPVVVDIV
ncbi:MAG TPA: exodeoxyribonuclease III [Jiangellaceae bacterium]|nr:exodeoxyribonuclease III [Jiangellaceae bacterium]